MSDHPLPATKLSIVANICDAVDPRHPLEARYEAVDRAMAADPAVAIAVAVEFLHAVLQETERDLGPEALEATMRNIRGMASNLFADGEF